VYGVGLANIFLLPAANKIKARIREDTQRKELMLEGVAGIVEGLNPKLMRGKLDAYAPSKLEPGKIASIQPVHEPAVPEGRAAAARR
jgi:chemotaxis protein MotA